MNLTATGSSEIKLKTWHHLVLVRDGNRFAVYIDGNTTPELAAEVSPAKEKRNSQLYIGGTSAGNDPTFEGKIDEVAVYRRALSAKEIAAHYAKAKP